MLKIGKRSPVTDLRTIWPKENDLSDWLVTDEGLSLIAEDIGVQVEEPQQECHPGDFRCDIVGHVLGEPGHVIVIENQFGKTNHDHLGKLLTYASSNSAMTAIWLAETISDDHRKVIDWLNDNTPERISFYLAQVKAYRIDDSAPAPQLDVVSRPNLTTKIERSGGGSEELRERHIWRKEFWEEILTYIRGQKPPFRVQSPTTDAWSNIALGRGDFLLSLTLTPRRGVIGCELLMTPAWKDGAFAQLESQKAAIEAEIGEALQWMPMPGKKSARIVLEAAIHPGEEANREVVKKWMYEKALRFYKTFQPRVKLLKPTQVSPEDNDVADGPDGKVDLMDGGAFGTVAPPLVPAHLLAGGEETTGQP